MKLILATDPGDVGQKNISRDRLNFLIFFMSEVKDHQLTLVCHQLDNESTYEHLIDEIGLFSRKSILHLDMEENRFSRKIVMYGSMPRIYAHSVL